MDAKSTPDPKVVLDFLQLQSNKVAYSGINPGCLLPGR
jgi:hypothetical protein